MKTLNPSISSKLSKDEIVIVNSILKQSHPFLTFVYSPIFKRKNAQETLDIELPEVDTDWYIKKVDENATDEIVEYVPGDMIKGTSKSRWWNKQDDGLEKEMEKVLFLKYNYLKLQISKAREKLQKKQSKVLVQELLDCYKQVSKIESLLTSAYLKLVIGTVTETKYRFLGQGGWDELISVGNEALLRAVRNFDAATNLRFSTFAWNTIKNALISFVVQKKKINDHEKQQAEEFDFTDKPTEENCSENLAQIMRAVVDFNIAELDKRELVVLKMRHPMDGSERKTLKYVASRLKMSIPSVVRIEGIVCNKLKNFLLQNAEKFGISEEVIE